MHMSREKRNIMPTPSLPFPVLLPLTLTSLVVKAVETQTRTDGWAAEVVCGHYFFLPSRSAHPSIDIKRLSRLTRYSNSTSKNSFLLLLYC